MEIAMIVLLSILVLLVLILIILVIKNKNHFSRSYCPHLKHENTANLLLSF